MNADTYLRRALFAPMIVPLLAMLSVYKNISSARPEALGADLFSDPVAVILISYLILGGIPYLWMLHARRNVLKHAEGIALITACKEMPFDTLFFFFKFWGMAGIVLAATVVYFPLAVLCLCIMFLGALAVPILGYLYVGVTFGFLATFQRLGLVEKGAAR